MRKSVVAVLSLVLAFSAPALRAADDDLKAQMEALKKEVEALRKEKGANDDLRRQVEALQKKDAASKPVGTGVVDKMVDNKYGPNLPVSTRQGKLTISGLLQVWYYSIQNDNLGFFGDRHTGTHTAAQMGDTNEGRDNDSFFIRKAELAFTMDIHENVTGFIKIDASTAFQSNRPSFPSNLGTSLRYATATATDQTAPTATDRLLDAYVNYHGVIPHHDIQIGQFKPFIGYEGIQSNSVQDFVERSMLGQLGDQRDIGLSIHGTWWSDRFQYWLGVFNTPTSFLSAAWCNRSDNNDAKSFAGRLLVRPVWKDKTWGSLELGMSSQFNETGEAGGDVLPAGTDGLEQFGSDSEQRHYAWATYAPGGPVKGWWLKGEYAWIRGRVATGTWSNSATLRPGYWVMSTTANQTMPDSFDVTGWYFSTGYKIGDSCFANDVPSWFKPFEFCFRYQTFGNIQVAKLVNPNKEHDVWKSSVYTAGVNYYIKGNNAKIQLNYNWACEPADDYDGGSPTPRLIRNVRNDNLMVNFQVAW